VQITRFEDAKTYEAKDHFGMQGLRLHPLLDEEQQGRPLTCGVSHFLPGGGAHMRASSSVRLYFLLSGEITVKTDQTIDILKQNDSCLIPSGEMRSIYNHTNYVTTMLVVIAGA